MNPGVSTALSARPDWRPDIAGLRALAVIPVMLFHADPDWLPGGYAGVDVFFVISGYLLTGIVLKEHARGEFSIVAFLERRARRILPALLVMMVCCIPFGWLTMLPDERENFGQSLVATLLFANNFLLWMTSGYFGLANEFKPLMHTWSLGVEEQFYLLFPFLMLFFLRMGRKQAIRLLLAVVLVSFILFRLVLELDWHAGFLLMPFRLWELLAGVMLAMCSGERMPSIIAVSANAISITGLLLLLAAYNLGSEYLYWGSLLAVAGTVLLLSGNSGTWAGRVLAGGPFVAVGLLSYSLYLWHQPLLAFLRLPRLEPPSASLQAGVLLLALVPAWLSWQFVEQPWLDKRRTSRKLLGKSALVSSALLLATGFTLHLFKGFPGRSGDLAGYDLDAYTNYNMAPRALNRGSFANDGRPRVLVAGNSFARDFINMGIENGIWDDMDLVYSASVPTCLGNKDFKSTTLAYTADVVIYGSPLSFPECWQNDRLMLEAAGIKGIAVIGTKNFGWNLNGLRQLPDPGRRSIRVTVDEQIRREDNVLAAAVGAEHFVDQLALLEDADHKVPIFTPDGELIAYDNRHLTPAGAKYLGSILFSQPQLAILQGLSRD